MINSAAPAIRVLVIGLYAGRGGVETSTMNYYRNFDHSKIQYDFINPYQEFYYHNEITRLGGRVYDVASFRSNPVKYAIDVYKIIRKYKYTIVNIPMLSALNPLPVLVAFVARVPNIIVHSHNANTNNRLKSVLHLINKPIVNMFSDYHWACSTEAARWLFYKKSRLVNNAIDLSLYKYSEGKRARIRQEFNLGNELVIGNIARLTPVKNHTFLLDILGEMHAGDIDRNAKLLIVGDGPCYHELETKAKRMGLSEFVIFAGDRSDATDFYSAMDVFVLPSKFEGLPMVGIEAQAAGTPIVCSDSVTPELDVSGIVQFVSTDDPLKEWCRAVNAAERISVAQSRALLTGNHYNIKNEVRDVEMFYDKIGT